MIPVTCGCGGEVIVDQTDGYDEYQVYCPKCFMSSGTFNTEAEAIEAWNKAMKNNIQISVQINEEKFEQLKNEIVQELLESIKITDAAEPEKTAKVTNIVLTSLPPQDAYICSNCGNRVEKIDHYCSQCGAKLEWFNIENKYR